MSTEKDDDVEPHAEPHFYQYHHNPDPHCPIGSLTGSEYHGVHPFPQPWMHNNCGPGCALEIVNAMLQHNPTIWDALRPEVAASLRYIQRCANGHVPNIPTPYKPCLVGSCATRAEHYTAQHVYQHLNSSRCPNDYNQDGMRYYRWGDFIDKCLLLEHMFGLLAPGLEPNSASIADTQFTLKLRTQCTACTAITSVPTLQLESRDACLRKYKELTDTNMPSTQVILDMHTGHLPLIAYLPPNPSVELDLFASTCKVCRARRILPTTVEGAPPPFIQIKSQSEVAIGELCLTIELTMEGGTKHKYMLVAVLYGGTLCCITLSLSRSLLSLSLSLSLSPSFSLSLSLSPFPG